MSDWPPALRMHLAWLAQGTCYFPRCSRRISYVNDHGEVRLDCHIAHIHARRKNGPRYSQEMVDTGRVNKFENLLLLCYYCHDKVDHKDTLHHYPPELLRKWKAEREGAGAGALSSLDNLKPEVLEIMISRSVQSSIQEIHQFLESLEDSNKEIVRFLRGLLRNAYTTDVDADVAATLQDSAYRLQHLQDTAEMLFASAPELVRAASILEGLDISRSSLQLLDAVGALDTDRLERSVEAVEQAPTHVENAIDRATSRMVEQLEQTDQGHSHALAQAQPDENRAAGALREKAKRRILIRGIKLGVGLSATILVAGALLVAAATGAGG